ncbi:FMN-binding negative transcriptional regulator [Pseudoalteromonas arctica]|uniref:FMN-binding negative transcriptional regulator n=1 Tax=Pseudoalteromonas arctica TaxID=394751 RepID=A0A7Y0HE27_9GAMM|nr:FMN-binding negative transcriptional regulator [Pseudoalteromonas arctica]NMM41709.1 FMN-binding negative transcriptional regulator [Pseudoalteromonas arctica]
MYPAKHFQQHDSKQLQQLVNSYPLATILMPNPQSQLNDICRVPVLYDTNRQLFIAHVAKYNPLSSLDGQSVNLLFSGDDCYLSPAYADNKTLPSWLYSSVYVTAKVRIVKDQHHKEQIIQRLTDHFEQHFTQPDTTKWQLDEVPVQHRHAMYQQLSFIEFIPSHWRGNFKLSQNKPPEIRAAIKQNLVLAGKLSIAELIN